MRFNTTQRMIDELSKYTIHCKCGHSIRIYPFEHKSKKVCNFCGRTAYKDKRAEFEDKLYQATINLNRVYE